MATKGGRMVTYVDYLLPINSNDHIIMWFCEIRRQTKTISQLPHCLWPQNLAGWRLTLSDLYPQSDHIIKSPNPLIPIQFLQCQVKYFSCCTTTATRPMATKLGKVVTYYKNL